jgi:hypothetical protein
MFRLLFGFGLVWFGFSFSVWLLQKSGERKNVIWGLVG